MAQADTWLRWQFVHQRDFASDAIALVGAGIFSHVDILLDSGELLGARSDSVGGKPPGVQVRPAGYLADKWDHQVIIAVPCTVLQKAVADSFAQGQLGKPYDPEAILAFVFGRNWREENAWFCSELGARYGEVSGVFAPLSSADNKIAPNALALVCSAMPGRTISVLK